MKTPETEATSPEKPVPYQPVKMHLYSAPNPFAGIPLETRKNMLREVGVRAKEDFNRTYPQLVTWFDTYDPLYLLAFCACRFLTSEPGVDKEAIEGKIDFGSHHLELLQAMALMRPRGGTPRPLDDRVDELQAFLKDLTDALMFSDLDLPESLSDEEAQKRMVLSEMKSQTLAIRNWAYPDQAFRHVKGLFSGRLSSAIAAQFSGVQINRLIDVFVGLTATLNDRLNAHFKKIAPMYNATDFDSIYNAYHVAFPGIKDDRDETRNTFDRLLGKNVEKLKSMLLMHSNLFLSDIFTITLDEIMEAYGEPSHRQGVKAILTHWSHEFGDLAERNPMHFLYSNPVLTKPFIAVTPESYFWVMNGILSHTLPGMLEGLIPKVHRKMYSEERSSYLEEQVMEVCRRHFPGGQVFKGSLYRISPEDSKQYENDILVIIDSTAIVLECKSHLLDAPAKRGGELRFIDTLEDMVVDAATQAHRFVEYLSKIAGPQELSTRRGVVNTVDTSKIVRYIPLSVTYENLGFVSADLKKCVESGLIKTSQELVPSICLTDLETIFETLESQAERIHYVSRRSEIERTMSYIADEADLFAFYLNNGFNIGDLEYGKDMVNLSMHSKELDPYYTARADGVVVPKPKLDLSEWWRDILKQIERRQIPYWTEIAYVLLCIARDAQDKLEKGLKELGGRLVRGEAKDKHNWVVLTTTDEKRPYGIVAFPYTMDSREERNQMLKRIASDFMEETPVLGVVVLGVSLQTPAYPYDVLAFVPGNAPDAPKLPGMDPERKVD